MKIKLLALTLSLLFFTNCNSYKSANSALVSGNFVTGFGADLQVEATTPTSGKHFLNYQSNIFNTLGGTLSTTDIVTRGANNYNTAGAVVAYP